MKVGMRFFFVVVVRMKIFGFEGWLVILGGGVL